MKRLSCQDVEALNGKLDLAPFDFESRLALVQHHWMAKHSDETEERELREALADSKAGNRDAFVPASEV